MKGVKMDFIIKGKVTAEVATVIGADDIEEAKEIAKDMFDNIAIIDGGTEDYYSTEYVSEITEISEFDEYDEDE